MALQQRVEFNYNECKIIEVFNNNPLTKWIHINTDIMKNWFDMHRSDSFERKFQKTGMINDIDYKFLTRLEILKDDDLHEYHNYFEHKVKNCSVSNIDSDSKKGQKREVFLTGKGYMLLMMSVDKYKLNNVEFIIKLLQLCYEINNNDIKKILEYDNFRLKEENKLLNVKCMDLYEENMSTKEDNVNYLNEIKELQYKSFDRNVSIEINLINEDFYCDEEPIMFIENTDDVIDMNDIIDRFDMFKKKYRNNFKQWAKLRSKDKKEIQKLENELQIAISEFNKTKTRYTTLLNKHKNGVSIKEDIKNNDLSLYKTISSLSEKNKKLQEMNKRLNDDINKLNNKYEVLERTSLYYEHKYNEVLNKMRKYNSYVYTIDVGRGVSETENIEETFINISNQAKIKAEKCMEEIEKRIMDNKNYLCNFKLE